MPIEGLIIGGATALVAAEVATWCFRAGAADQRQIRRGVVRQERQKRAAIERETRQRLAQEAYEQRGAWLDMLTECMDVVWEMRNQTRDLRSQFFNVIKSNRDILKGSPLTIQQQEAIRDCNFHLERGVETLSAYSGPYLQMFVNKIRYCKSEAFDNNFVEPEMPKDSLPDDFPVVGDNLRLSKQETSLLRESGKLYLGGHQVGSYWPVDQWTDDVEQVDVFVSGFDRDSSTWTLSPAKGAIASWTRDSAAVPVEANLLSRNRGGYEAVWHSPYGESVDLFLPFSLANNQTREAPWGTRVSLYLHSTDYRARRITVGQTLQISPEESGLALVIHPSSVAQISVIRNALEISADTFWLRSTKGNEILLRLATGEEFPVKTSDRSEAILVGEQVGLRLGHVDGAICKSSVSLCINDGNHPSQPVINGGDFLERISQRLDEQDELRSIFEEEVLETGKYQLLLEAEIQASKSQSKIEASFSKFEILNNRETDQVRFFCKDDISSVDNQMACLLYTSPSPRD